MSRTPWRAEFPVRRCPPALASRAAFAVMVALVAAVALPGRAVAEDRWPGVASAYLVRIDGDERWSSNASARLEPASLTKLMTALLAVDALAPRDRVAVSRRAATAGGAKLGLAAGTTLAAEDLLAASLLRSANDACLALAERVAGSEAAFVARMNERARAMGLADTRFANACGLPAAKHYASARDLATLADAAMRQPRIAAIVRRERGSATASDGRVFRFENGNALIGRVEGARGIKTGWTRSAGRCLVADAERGGVRVSVVLLGAPDRWWDAVAMIESAFEDARSRRAPGSPRT